MSIVRIYMYVCVGVIVGTIFLFAYWLFFPVEVVDFTTLTMPIVNPGNIVVAGTPVEYETSGFQYIGNIPNHTDRSLIDHAVINFPPVDGISIYGAFDRVNATIVVPVYLPAGTYTLRVVTTYKVNPLRMVTIVRTTEPFQVVAAPPPVAVVIVPPSPAP